ncbi:DEAD (Asp-Glu-Ala-Asp) box polypeptide 56, partial [Chelydra serpentina]
RGRSSRVIAPLWCFRAASGACAGGRGRTGEQRRLQMESSFARGGLDGRLLQAITELGWAKPTLIQEKAIPLALEGKDLLARARTGSGKTAAYAIPLIQHLLQLKMSPSVMEQAVRGLVLVPTKELGQQVLQMIRQLTAYCSRDVRVADVSGQVDMSAQRPILMEKPDVVVGTPSRVLAHLQGHSLRLRHSLEMLVLDEADLLFSFGFEEDLKNLLWVSPRGTPPQLGLQPEAPGWGPLVLPGVPACVGHPAGTELAGAVPAAPPGQGLGGRWELALRPLEVPGAVSCDPAPAPSHWRGQNTRLTGCNPGRVQPCQFYGKGTALDWPRYLPWPGPCPWGQLLTHGAGGQGGRAPLSSGAGWSCWVPGLAVEPPLC